MWRVSSLDFYAATIAIAGVLLLGILQGILLAALASVMMLLARASRPNAMTAGQRFADRGSPPSTPSGLRRNP
jgi:MFS superfamily sulfate permease-like transporter